MNYQEKAKVLSTKWVTKDLISKFDILNGTKHFSLGRFQN